MNKKTSLLTLTGLAVGVSNIAAQSPAPVNIAQRPNVIFILADDLGYGDLGCYGQQKIETPNIDKLAAEGKRFTQFYAGCSLSSPSRCTLFTGMHTGHAVIRGNDEMAYRGDVWSHEKMYKDASLEGQRPLPAGTITFPLLFQQAEYATACVGKWGLGNPGSEGAPENMGFDFFYGYNCQRQAHNYYTPFLYRNDVREYIPNRIYQPGEYALPADVAPDNKCYYDNFNQGVYSPDLMYDEIISFVENNSGSPFLLTWTTTIPHMGLQAPERWIEYYHEKFGDEKPYLGNEGYYPSIYPRATYAAMVSTLDEQVGGLVAKLRELGIYENTIIIFTSDNGSANKGGPDPDWFNGGGMFRAGKGWGKGTLHEGGIRVPFIASWPGVIAPGTTSDHICAGWDVFATLCEVAGIEPHQTDGISMLPELTGGQQHAHEYLYWEYPGAGGSKAVRYGKWKGLLRNIKKGNDKIELYDLESDPRETTDLADKYPRIVKKIRKMMDESHTDSDNPLFRI